MKLTPGKILSVPIYSTSGVIALAGLIFIVPGGLLFLGAMLLCWLADKLTSDNPVPDYPTTIEEYEEYGECDVAKRPVLFYYTHDDGSIKYFDTYEEFKAYLAREDADADEEI